jgi:hypothetical protein
MYHLTTDAFFKLNLVGWERNESSPAANPSASSGNRYQILLPPEAFSRRVTWWNYRTRTAVHITLADIPIPLTKHIPASSPTQRHKSVVLDVRLPFLRTAVTHFAAVIPVGWSKSTRSSSLLVHYSPPFPTSPALLQSGPDRPRRPTRASTGLDLRCIELCLLLSHLFFVALL